MDRDLTVYVFAHYGHLMNESERLAHRHLSAALKITMGRSDEPAQEEARHNKTFSKFVSDDPEALRLARGGFEHFREQTAARIYNDYAAEISLNYCPKCGKLAKTPLARQCRHCGHDWHFA